MHHRLQRLRNQGRLQRGSFIHETVGYNFRITDVQAAMGLAQLRRLDAIIAAKLEHHRAYCDALAATPQVRILQDQAEPGFVPARCVVMAERAAELSAWLAARNIEVRAVFAPLHRQPCFVDHPGVIIGDENGLPNADYAYAYAYAQGVCLRCSLNSLPSRSAESPPRLWNSTARVILPAGRRAFARQGAGDMANAEFEIRGVNHLALVCKDMARTVAFYRDLLGMPLIKTIDLPGGMGQHFFFDIGNGDSLAFFWFPNAPEAAPGVSSPAFLPTEGSMLTAHGSMNHIAFNIPAEKFDDYYARLQDKGVKVTPILNHDDSEWQVSRDVHAKTFVRSVYFFDPDGVCLEFAAWTKPFDDTDVAHDPMTAEGTRAAGMILDALARNDETAFIPAE